MQVLAAGNGKVSTCALNLMRTVRGQVPYARTKGNDRALIDIPSTGAWRYRADAEWVLKSYEPRAESNDLELYAGADTSAVAHIE